MAFSYTLYKRQMAGNLWMAWGTFTNSSGSAGGDIDTGLSTVDHFAAFYTSSSSTAPYANETFPLTHTAVSLVTGANDTGLWFALGTM